MTKSFEQMQREYAQLLIRFGLNLQKGQNLILNAPIQAHDFVLLLAEAAYEAWVQEIFYRRNSEALEALRYSKAPEEVFGQFPLWLAEGYTQEVKNNCAVLSLYVKDPYLLQDANPHYLEKDNKARSLAFKNYKDFISSNGTNWLVASIPTIGWANAIYGNDDKDNINKLRNQIFKLVRIDQENPLNAWQSHIEQLNTYARFLNTHQFSKLHYHWAKTDLIIELPEGHRWISAGEKTKSGIPFCPNMPTEEVFSMPHKYWVNGTVFATLPLEYQGKLIKNFSLTFKNGEVIDFSAEEGYETLKALLETDPGSKRLGEVAIVPISSPIYQSGLIYFNTLFDENASCHLALGSAYPMTLNGADQLTTEEKDQAWMNESISHVDFMIGDEHLSITGITKQGEEICFFEQGEWKITKK